MAKSGFSEALIDACVDFWAKALVPPEEEFATPQDAAAMTRLMTHNPVGASVIDRARARMKPTPEKLELFKTKLRELLAEPYPDGTDPRERPYGCISPRWVELRTDYQAQGLLLLAAKHAGISDMAFPFKTIVTIKHGRVTTGFPPRVLFEGPAPVGPFGQVD